VQIQFADGGSWVLRGKLSLIELMLGQCTPSEALVLYIKVEEVGEVGCGGTSLVTLVWGYTGRKDERWEEGRNNYSNDCLIHVATVQLRWMITLRNFGATSYLPKGP